MGDPTKPSKMPVRRHNESESSYNRRRSWWFYMNTQVWGIFVKDWIRICTLLPILYVLLGLMFWGLLSAATNVRQNSFLSIPEDDHFGDDYVMTVIEFGVRGEAVYAGQARKGRMGFDQDWGYDELGYFNIVKPEDDGARIGSRTFKTGHGKVFPWVTNLDENDTTACRKDGATAADETLPLCCEFTKEDGSSSSSFSSFSCSPFISA